MSKRGRFPLYELHIVPCQPLAVQLEQQPPGKQLRGHVLRNARGLVVAHERERQVTELKACRETHEELQVLERAEPLVEVADGGEAATPYDRRLNPEVVDLVEATVRVDEPTAHDGRRSVV